MTKGERVGPYEILDAIGAGGMGEVWKARDTRLDRSVAIKISKEQFSERFGNHVAGERLAGGRGRSGCGIVNQDWLPRGAAQIGKIALAEACFAHSTPPHADEYLARTIRVTPEISKTFYAALRGRGLMNHLIHHRGQLTVYLRLLDVSIPGVYGPSADQKS